MASFIGGLTSGLASGLKEKSKGGSLIDRFKKNFGSKPVTPAAGTGVNDPSAAREPGPDDLPKMHSGGRIPKSGIYRMKKGEVVVPAKVVNKIEKATRGARKKVRKTGRKSGRR